MNCKEGARVFAPLGRKSGAINYRSRFIVLVDTGGRVHTEIRRQTNKLETSTR